MGLFHIDRRTGNELKRYQRNFFKNVIVCMYSDSVFNKKNLFEFIHYFFGSLIKLFERYCEKDRENSLCITNKRID